MGEQVLLSSVSFDGVRERGGFGQPLHALYPQIRAVLASELGSDTADLLAEPVVDRVHNRIDWYIDGDPEPPPIALSDLPEDQRQPILERVHGLLERGRQLADRYVTSDNGQRAQLGAILKAVLSPPTENEVFLVHGRPVVAHWGFSADRPWATSGVSIRTVLTSPDEPRSERILPDIMIPEWEAETLQVKVAGEGSSVRESVESAAAPEIPPGSPPEPPVEPSAPAPRVLLAKPDELAGAPPPEPPSAGASELNPGDAHSTIRYVVVGSRYFWSIVILALLLALGAALWSMTRSPGPAATGETAPLPADAGTDRALAEAQNVEQALRRQLEQRLVDLAGQQGRCAPPSAGNAAAAPAPAGSPVSPESPAPPADLAAALMAPGSSTGAEAGQASPSPPSPPPPGGRETKEPLTRALEEPLNGAPSGAAPSAEPSGESPVPTEPTPAERQEFADRLSATGAKTGEITVTLLWDGNADLDLVVRCPSGEMLDYLTPKGCGGSLDVDANSARETLSEKPVENIFWPAGQATPGSYKIVVRYEPRKDERNPQTTPFQVRLIRDGQEQVFKGTLRPRKTLSIANFTVVER